MHTLHKKIRFGAGEWLALAVLLTAFGGWLVGFVWLHMRPDEFLVYQHTEGSLWRTIWYQARRDVQAPLWHSFFWHWRFLGGDSEFVGRYQGILWSSLTLSLVYLLGKTWFAAPRFGIFAMATLAVNTYFFTYAFEIRPYPLVLLVATFSMWSLRRWLWLGTWRAALIYGASLGLMGYVHYFLAFLVLAQGIYLLFVLRGAPRWKQYAGAVALGGLIWLPWSHTFYIQVQTLRAIEGSLGIATTAMPTSLPVIQNLLWRATNGLPLIWLSVLAVGAVWVRRREYALVLLWALGVPMIAFTLNLFANVYEPRYVSYLVVGLGVGAGVALAGVPSRLLRGSLWVAFVGVMLWHLSDYLPKRTTYRPIYQQMSSQSREGDWLFFDDAEEGRDFVKWQMNQYLAPHLLANSSPSLDDARQHARVWHLTVGWFNNPAVQPNFRELERTRPLTAVLGRCDLAWCYYAQLLEGAPPQDAPLVFESPRSTDRITLVGAETFLTDETRTRLQVKLWWTVPQALSQDYAVSVRLVDASGSLLAQADAPPTERDGALRQTSTLEAERVILDWRALPLTAPLPAGTYRVQAVVYHPIDGYTLSADGTDLLTLETITVP